MRALALALSGLLLSLATVRADEAADVQAIITHQLEAFAQDDAEAAYGFAAPAIRAQFGDAATFLQMVKAAYPAVYRHRSAEFGPEERAGERARQKVVFVDRDNVVWSGVYLLALQPDGAWRIEGCALKRSDDTSL